MRLFLECVEAPVGDGASVGGKCVFPFTYNNIQYNSCTTVDSKNAWCYTVANARPGSPWGTCTPCGKY